MRAPVVAVLLILLTGALSPVAAQTAGSRPAPALELTGGYAGFLDSPIIDHTMFGGALRFYLTPRISIGPEVQYMIGPDIDRDLIVTGNLIVDFLSPRADGRPRATPYVVVGGGWFHNTMRVGAGSYSSSEGAFTWGGGYRAWIARRVYVAPEFRWGWEAHYRVSGTVGIALPR